ncbi:hypothetical protein BGX31_009116 [Mortierella sp. GBA43]|nr:hypothetical protein BGX31_009116 [Mortierella sp. GBA43]
MEDQTVRQGLASAYIDLGKVLDSRGHRAEAQVSYRMAEEQGSTCTTTSGTKEEYPSTSRRV